MNRAFRSLISADSLRAVLLREFRDALINRYFQVFAALSLLGGAAAIVFSEDEHTVAFLILQVALYFVSLFALLAGATSAQAERDEWQMLFSQPVPRAAYVVGKFIAYLSIFAAVLLLLFVPALLSGSQSLTLLYAETLLLAAAFLALGLAVGFFTHDRAQASHRRNHCVVDFTFRHRSRRSFRRAVGVRSKSARCVERAAHVESARRISNRSTLRS